METMLDFILYTLAVGLACFVLGYNHRGREEEAKKRIQESG